MADFANRILNMLASQNIWWSTLPRAIAVAAFAIALHLCITSTCIAGKNESLSGIVGDGDATQTDHPQLDLLLSQLEDRSVWAQGTWQFTASENDTSKMTSLLDIGDKSWTWGSKNVQEGICICSDNAVVELPQGMRYPMRGIVARGVITSPAEILLQFNLNPRSTLSWLGEGTLIGWVNVHAESCAHVRYVDSSLAVTSADQHVADVDVYIDPVRNLVLKVDVVCSNGTHSEAVLDECNNFGTSHAWPIRISESRIVDTQLANKLSPVRRWTTVSFRSHDFTLLRNADDSLRKLGFYCTPPELLESPAVYAAAVAGSADEREKNSYRVAFAESEFQCGDLQKGLSEWKTIKDSLPTGDDRKRLESVIVPLAAESAWRSSSHPDAVDPVSEVLAEAEKDCTGDVDWSRIRTSVMLSCFNLAEVGHMEWTKFSSTLRPLLSRLANTNDVETLAILISHAKTNEDYGRVMFPIFESRAAHPLPESGYLDSSNSYLIAAAIQVGDIDLARHYLSELPNGSSVPSQVIDGLRVLNGKNNFTAKSWLPNSIQMFECLKELPFLRDPTTSALRSQYIEQSGDLVLRSDNPSDLLICINSPAAADYWDQVVRSSSMYVKTAQDARKLAEVARSYERIFAHPSYEAQIWLRLSANFSGKSRLETRLACLRSCIDSAKDDETRMAGIHELVQVMVAANQFDRAAAVLKKYSESMGDVGAQKQLSEMTTWIAVQHDKTVLVIKTELTRHRRVGELSLLQSQLENMKQQANEVPANIASIERLIAELQNQLKHP